jgi:heavy metal efflux system protein
VNASELPAPNPPRRASSVINRIVASSLRQRFLVILSMLLLTGAGGWSLNRLPVEAYPDLSPPMVEVITQWPGRAAEEVERLITVPIEIEMNGIPRMTVLRSISLYGLSDVLLTFRNGTDNYFARQQVFERIPEVSLPTGVTPSVAPLFSPSGLIYRYVLQSPDRSPLELKTIEDWIVERQYKSVPGVADDSGLGGETMQYQVLLDPVRVAGQACRPRRSSPRWAITMTMPTVDSIPRGANFITCAAWVECTRRRISATSCSPCITAFRYW